MVTYLSDAVPVDDDAFGVERVLELDVDGVAGAGADGWARELPVDADHYLLLAVGRPEHVADLPLEVPGLGRLRRAMLPRHQDAAHQGQLQQGKKPHACCLVALLQCLQPMACATQTMEEANGMQRTGWGWQARGGR